MPRRLRAEAPSRRWRVPATEAGAHPILRRRCPHPLVRRSAGITRWVPTTWKTDETVETADGDSRRSAGRRRGARGGVHLDARRQREHVGGHHPAPGDQRGLGDAPVAQLQWAVTGYSLVGAAVIVTSGALGDVLGRRKVFLGGLVLFIGSCVLIALSTGGRRRDRRPHDPGRRRARRSSPAA